MKSLHELSPEELQQAVLYGEIIPDAAIEEFITRLDALSSREAALVNELNYQRRKSKEPILCGQNSAGVRIGCGEQIADIKNLYRCGDCSTPFHQQCLKEHFGVHQPREKAMVEAVRQVLEWYDRDGSVGGCSIVMEVLRASIGSYKEEL